MIVLLSSILQLLLHLLSVVAALRIMMRACFVSPHAPLAPFVIQLTRPFIKVLSLIIPSSRRIDIPAVVLLLILVFFQFVLVYGLPDTSKIIPLILFMCLKSIETMLNIFFFAILVKALISWISPQSNLMNEQLLVPLTYWIEMPVRRIIPAIGGVDLSPMILLFIIQMTQNLVLRPLMTQILFNL